MWAEAMSSERSDSAPVISDSRPGRSRHSTSITEKRFDSVLRMSARGVMRKVFWPRFGLARFSIISGSQLRPDSTSSIRRPTRVPRRCSSSSRSNSREIRIVSSARPSAVVKICASTMLPPAAAQAPAITDSRRGWSCARTVISVTASKACVLTMVASCRLAALGLADEFGMAQLVRQVDGQQVVLVVQLDVARCAPARASRPAPRPGARAPRRRAGRARPPRSRRSAAARSRK